MQYVLGLLIIAFGVFGLLVPTGAAFGSRVALIPLYTMNAGTILLGLAVIIKRTLESPVYAGAMKRVGASIIDWTIISAFTFGLSFWNPSLPIWAFIPTYALGILAMPILCIWCHTQSGRTPGKFLVKIKVVAEDFSRIGLRQSLLRSSVELGLSILLVILGLSILLKANAGNELFSYEVQQDVISKCSSLPYYLVMGLNNIWFMAEAISMMLNGKRRAIHDFMAGTVIVDIDAEKGLGLVGADNLSGAK